MKIVTFLTMPFQQKRLFFINFILCGIARAAINLLSYKHISRYFGQPCRMLSASTLVTPAQMKRAYLIGRSVKLAAKYTPWNSSCLTQAMVAKFWCNHYKIPYMFFIGFARVTEKKLGQDAHAWITAGPVAITGGHSFTTHHVVSSYSNHIKESR